MSELCPGFCGRNGLVIVKLSGRIPFCSCDQLTGEAIGKPAWARGGRLDLDWRWHQRALELGCMMSINPDAHSIAEIELTRWGRGDGEKRRRSKGSRAQLPQQHGVRQAPRATPAPPLDMPLPMRTCNANRATE
jgi:hypothetical protein